MDRGAWRVAVHGVTESQTGLKRLSVHTRNGRMSEKITLNTFLMDF